ncbi:MAG TPA: response regulator [Verrucomicrobiae bacterium]|nr:response regulator [Verrucomicrobiae bacterium]
MTSRILIVDDSAFARRKLRQALESAGYYIEEAASGPQALEKYSLHKPDVVLLDLVMEGMDGLQVLAQLRAMDPNANVIVATADVQSATREEAFKSGAAGILNKPFNPEEVLAAVQRVAERASS